MLFGIYIQNRSNQVIIIIHIKKNRFSNWITSTFFVNNITMVMMSTEFYSESLYAKKNISLSSAWWLIVHFTPKIRLRFPWATNPFPLLWKLFLMYFQIESKKWSLCEHEKNRKKKQQKVLKHSDYDIISNKTIYNLILFHGMVKNRFTIFLI